MKSLYPNIIITLVLDLNINGLFSTAMNVLGDSIGCAVVQANVDLAPIEKPAIDNEAFEEAA